MTPPVLFPIGTEVLCDCEQECKVSGVIIGYRIEDDHYLLEGGAIALIPTARKLYKLEKAMK